MEKNIRGGHQRKKPPIVVPCRESIFVAKFIVTGTSSQPLES